MNGKIKMRKLGYLVFACALTTINVVNAAAPTGMEQCYGIAKAGQNDCSTDSTCDKSVIDGDPNYFLYVPTGFCSKIVGGALTANSDAVPGSTSMPSTPSSTMPSSSTTPSAPSSTMPSSGTMPSTPSSTMPS